MGIGAAILGSAVVGVAGSAFASNKQSKAAGKAADAQGQAALAQVDLGREQLDYVKEIQAPYQEVGVNALSALAGQTGIGGPDGQAAVDAPDYSAFYTSPGYEFRLREGQKAINNSLLAQGRGLSGSQLRAANDYAQGQAAGEYGNYYNRLSSLAGLGQTANTAAIGGTGAATGTIGQGITNAGNAAAGGYYGEGAANAGFAQNLTGIASGTLGNYMFAKALGMV